MRTSQPSKPTTGTNTTGPHGLGAGLGAAGTRLPVPPRERKPALAALAVLLILGGALVSAYLVIQSGQRISAIAIAAPVAAGEQIPENALKAVTISNTGVDFIRWDERSKVVGVYATLPLAVGTLLNNNMLTQTQENAIKGRVVVGLSLKPGQVPVEVLKEGQQIALYAVGGRTESGVKPGTLLSADAYVYKLQGSSRSGSSLASRTSSSAELRLSVAVLPEQAPAIAQAASSGDVAVAVVPAGTTVPLPQTKPQQTKPGG